MNLKCLLIGHKFYQDFATGKYADKYEPLTARQIKVPITRREHYKYCLRCNAENLNHKYATNG
jgi:hypothetical protein